MKELFRKALGGRIGWVLVLIGWGCSDEQSGLFIQGNVRMLPPACEARAEATSTLLLEGVLDVALKLEYDANLLVGSQLTPRADKDNLRSETMVATVEGAEVHLYSDTGAVLQAFTVPATGVILPNGSDEAGYGIIHATLLPEAEGNELAQELAPLERRTRVAEISVFGKTVGGLEIESASMRYVIEVCNGCLIDYPVEAVDQMGNCTLARDQAVELPCNPGQDSPTDCRRL